MKLWFVANWIRDFLKQLHANMAKQPFAVVKDPTAPGRRAGPKTFPHPRCASSRKPRFGFGCRFGFSTKPVAQFSQSTGIT
jgi:hypothetical protein